MLRLLVVTAVLGLAVPPAACQEPGPLVVDADRLWDGTSWSRNRRLVVRDGVVAAMGPREGVGLPAGARRMRVAWLLPGLVLADSVAYAGKLGDRRSVTPGIRVADGYDPWRPQEALNDAGVTLLYLSPGRSRLVAGQGAVVRLGAVHPKRWLVRDPAALQVSVTPGAMNPGELFDPPVPPGPDDRPIEPPRRQFPQARGGAFLALRELLQAAAGPAGSRAPEGHLDPDLRALKPILEGEVPLRVRAETAADILGAVRLARSRELKLVIEGAREAWKVAGDLATAGAAVVLASGTPPGGSLPPPPPFDAEEGRARRETAARLHAAGVPLALVPPEGGSPRDLLWYAAQSRTDGFGEGEILHCVTAGAAQVLGLSGGAGTLAPGVPADLAAYDMHPLSAPARPVLVVSGGKVLHEHEAEAETTPPIAIVAGEVLTGDGGRLEDAVVLVEDGRIVGLGPHVTIPVGARLVRRPDAVVVPGFIDAGTQVGLRGYRTGSEGGLETGRELGSLPLDETPARYFDPTFADARAAAAFGVTTVVLTPGEGRGPSGVLSVVKTGAVSPEKAVLRELAGIAFDHGKDRWSPPVLKKLEGLLKKARSYDEAWKTYERELAAWKKKQAGDQEGAGKRRSRLKEVTAPRARDPVSGTWEGTAVVDALSISFTMELTLEGKRATGTLKSPMLPVGELPVSASYRDEHLTFSLGVQGVTVEIALVVGRDEMTGTWEAPQVGRSGTVRAHRTALPPAEEEAGKKQEKPGKAGEDKAGKGKAGGEDGPPKKPKKNPKLEPYRDLLAGRIAAHLEARSPRLARHILELLTGEYGIKVVLRSQKLAPELMDHLAELGVGLAPSTPVSWREEGRLHNPALEAVRRGIPVMLRSGVKGDARTLYASAAFAVRNGLNPDDALRMLTFWPACALGVDGRVGVLQTGMDADLVVLSGRPFEPATRILEVMADGRFVKPEEERR